MSKKQKYSLEFVVRCSPTILFDFLSNPTGLQEWFADVVNMKDNMYSFTWRGGQPEKAEVLEKEFEKFIKFRWLSSDKDEFFEFRITKTEISNQTILTVTDFADKADLKDNQQLWDYQVKELLHRIGA